MAPITNTSNWLPLIAYDPVMQNTRMTGSRMRFGVRRMASPARMASMPVSSRIGAVAMKSR